MYNVKYNPQSFQRNSNGSSYNSRPNVRQGYSFTKRRNPGKKLDPNLFIKKATTSNSNEIEMASNVLFSDYLISEKLKRNIATHGYTSPTIIQEKTIPHLLEMKDVIGIANTGTGKTAAFLIPLINKAEQNRNEHVLIIVPTRELAMQIFDEFKIFAKGMELEAAICIGGANIRRQEMNLRHNPHFVIGTPGRLKDLTKRGKLNLMLFPNIVLDEVDRMVDIGFVNDIKYLVSLLPKKRQSLFFSATINEKAEEILRNFVTDPITVSVKQQATAENIDQDIIKVTNSYAKLDMLHDLLIKKEFQKVLIFGRTKWGVEKLYRTLIDRGFKAAAIHGNKSQNQRQHALDQFKQNELQILLATDVASRGLDIDDVTHVINYDVPESYDDYVHRIGRTGRAGKKGIALTFIE